MQSQAHAGTIANELHNKNFEKTGVRYSAIRVTRTSRAVLEDSVWKADVIVSMKVATAT